MDESQIPVQDTASDPEDPEYYEKCLSDFEDQHEDSCAAWLDQHLSLRTYLNTPAAIYIDSLADEYFGPDQARKKDIDHG
jgi:hypothetical protein